MIGIIHVTGNGAQPRGVDMLSSVNAGKISIQAFRAAHLCAFKLYRTAVMALVGVGMAAPGILMRCLSTRSSGLQLGRVHLLQNRDVVGPGDSCGQAVVQRGLSCALRIKKSAFRISRSLTFQSKPS